jgi:hypothetical protein
MLPFVEHQPVAEILPGLYRAVLDAVGELERLGARREAARIREDAIRTYSGAWNEAAAHRLRRLQARVLRVKGGRAARKREVAADRLVDLGHTSV